jgi:hypothetical protein
MLADERRFAPRDVPSATTVNGMCELFERCDIPSSFVAESLQDVSQSFSAQKDAETTCIFFHLLVKDVAISNGRIVDIERSDGVTMPGRQSQANLTWLKSGFVFRFRNDQGSTHAPSRTTTSSSDSTLTSTTAKPIVEMFCFGAPVALRDRFQKLMDTATCEDILLDPYILLEVVLGEMYKVMDRTAWAVSDIFGKIEEASVTDVLFGVKQFLIPIQQTLEMATTPGRVTKELLDFQGLHNLAKHNIYLHENCESALATLDDLRDHHNSTLGGRPTPPQEYTKQALKYQKTLFQSTQRRIASVDRRIENIIQLSFNIATQGDSRLMQSESQSMKTIAIMTLFFMPVSSM